MKDTVLKNYENMMKLISQVSSISYALKSTCEKNEEEIPEFAKLKELVVLLEEKCNKLYDFF